VELISFVPMLLLVQAKRTKAVPIFEKPPLQSDYSRPGKASAPGESRRRAAAKLSRTLPGLARLINAASYGLEFYRRQSLRNRRFFRPTRKP